MLKKSAPSRIVNVSSIGANLGKLNVNNLNAYPKYSYVTVTEFLMYCNTKLCNILFTRVLAEKLKNYNVNVNVLHPGVSHTNIWYSLKGITRHLILFMINTFFMVKHNFFFRYNVQNIV